jgi:hypothetical protein
MSPETRRNQRFVWRQALLLEYRSLAVGVRPIWRKLRHSMENIA